MKILIAFYSRDGHTRKAADILGKILNADLDEVVDNKNRKGILGFLRAGYDATMEKTTEITFSKDPSEYDLVVVGTPVWNGRLTPAIRTYLLQNREKIKNAVFFVTCAGRPGKCLKQMKEIYGKEVLMERVKVRKRLEGEARVFAEELERLIHTLKGP
ncbi:flavodoxin domain-containing protein [Thermotoga sp. KOL6]|uniref:flavodoxin family protein n=1 Tax=Thermotoga sp. KOL6 TaxID=126741 RepID=UPI000C794BD9|nr:flavodoxin domain-containing protein [Thermotoga sp. KOL6]PLV59911.1 flavodoxin [Thermotoga sp. KOL6]